MNPLFTALTASDWITLFSALATLMISIVSGIFVIKFNKWNRKREIESNLAKQEDKLEDMNRQFQNDIFSINSDISKESIHILDESFKAAIAKNKAIANFSKKAKENTEELQQSVYRSRLEISSQIEKHVYKFKNILRQKEMLITQYYKSKLISDEYKESNINVNNEIIYRCNVCNKVFDIQAEWNRYIKLSSSFTHELKDINNINKDFTKQLEEFVLESNVLEQLIGYGVVLSKNYKYYLKDEFIMFHDDCD
ncbi:hypothetical protein STIUS_v1c01600 [Spiroplasma sp. TIUS-1]|uniref:hypothetical protein n=1 Tax=Spiroplasma sp. TIUS-1 TaxID=216963 RepID=UPI001396DF87|nr:hypothetical protein [Spiroplasma sp. TIUS-1]QHX35715.1 hypothetical protein STIUS_v1c01600 [Spiroplasma sp. TIUS-1]